MNQALSAESTLEEVGLCLIGITLFPNESTIPRSIAELKLASIDIDIDVLALEQEQYIIHRSGT